MFGRKSCSNRFENVENEINVLVERCGQTMVQMSQAIEILILSTHLGTPTLYVAKTLNFKEKVQISVCKCDWDISAGRDKALSISELRRERWEKSINVLTLSERLLSRKAIYLWPKFPQRTRKFPPREAQFMHRAHRFCLSRKWGRRGICLISQLAPN